MVAHKKSSSLWHLTELRTTTWIRALRELIHYDYKTIGIILGKYYNHFLLFCICASNFISYD